MAFWGAEVKPGRPFILHPYNGRRLHVSQATLGKANLGINPTSMRKIVVQCNVGDKTPVSICSLFSDKLESFQLNLEFEETVDVVFSVIGPHTVHLSGYYLRGAGQFDADDDGTETYGEDIANTESERSVDGTDDEDDYDDSFINDDDDLGDIPPSPVPSIRVDDSLEERKPKHGKVGNRRLRKKYQVTESGDEWESSGKSYAKDASVAVLLDGEGEDAMPISFFRKNEPTRPQPKEEKARKSKGRRKEERPHEVSDGDDFFFGNEVFKWDKAVPSETGADKSGQNLPLMNKDDQKNANDIEDSMQDFVKPSAVMVSGNVAEARKREKKQDKEENFHVTPNAFMKVIGEDKAQQSEATVATIAQDMPVTIEENQNRATNDSIIVDKAQQDDPTGANIGHDELGPMEEIKEQQDEPKADNIRLDMPATNAETQKQANDKEGKTPEQQDEPKADNIQLDMPATNAENQREDKTALQKAEPKADNMQLDTSTTNAESRKQENDEGDKVPKDDFNPENTEHVVALTTKENQKLANDGKVKVLHYEAGAENSGQVRPVADEETMKGVVLACLEPDTENVARSKTKRKERANRILDNAVEQSADENHSEKKRKKKKKSKGIREETREPFHVDSSVQSINEESRSVVNIEDNNSGDKSSQHRILSNGLVIKELETGKTDGKIAAPGKKITINYTGMLKDSGEVFESNVDGAPYKFRLGKGRVLKGLDIGIDGMRVGAKRRVIVPPPLGYGSEGEDFKNVPPDAWLVYDVELLHVK